MCYDALKALVEQKYTSLLKAGNTWNGEDHPAPADRGGSASFCVAGVLAQRN